MSSPITIPYKTAAAIAQPMCAPIFVGPATIVVDSKRRRPGAPLPRIRTIGIGPIEASAGHRPGSGVDQETDRGPGRHDCCAEPAESRFRCGDKKDHILVIDDDVNIHKLARKALTDSGLEVTACFDGESGLAEIERRPAVVIVDLLMPRMDGFNLIDRLRRIQNARTLPIVVWTNLDLTGLEFQKVSKEVAKVVNLRGLDIARLIAELRTESLRTESGRLAQTPQ